MGEHNGGDAPAQQEQGAEHSTSPALAGACPAAAGATHPLSWPPADELHQHPPQGAGR